MKSTKRNTQHDNKVEIGYFLASEEHPPQDLIRYAQMAEEAGFTFALISDHFHPWVSKQGQSPFVWSTIGGISQVTKTLCLGTGVTCPTIRIHPAIIAQAAATSAVMLPRRFFLSVGSGENLNEHVTGTGWPAYELRSAMLEEAVEVIRMLLEGGSKTYYGSFYVVENARIYTLPNQPIPIMVAADGPKAAELAGRIGDGLVSTSPDKSLVEKFMAASDKTDPPCYGEIAVCWDETESKAVKIALEQWPNTALPGELIRDLPTPLHFEEASSLVTQEQISKTVICGNDPEPHLNKIEEFIEAGFRKVHIHQIGLNQTGFFRFYKKHILPAFKQA